MTRNYQLLNISMKKFTYIWNTTSSMLIASNRNCISAPNFLISSCLQRAHWIFLAAPWSFSLQLLGCVLGCMPLNFTIRSRKSSMQVWHCLIACLTASRCAASWMGSTSIARTSSRDSHSLVNLSDSKVYSFDAPRVLLNASIETLIAPIPAMMSPTEKPKGTPMVVIYQQILGLRWAEPRYSHQIRRLCCDTIAGSSVASLQNVSVYHFQIDTNDRCRVKIEREQNFKETRKWPRGCDNDCASLAPSMPESNCDLICTWPWKYLARVEATLQSSRYRKISRVLLEEWLDGKKSYHSINIYHLRHICLLVNGDIFRLWWATLNSCSPCYPDEIVGKRELNVKLAAIWSQIPWPASLLIFSLWAKLGVDSHPIVCSSPHSRAWVEIGARIEQTSPWKRLTPSTLHNKNETFRWNHWSDSVALFMKLL